MENGIDIDARHLLKIREQILDLQKRLKDLRNEEQICIKNIKSYFNETSESGIRIDDDVVIELNTRSRKIPMTRSQYQQHLEEILSRPENFENLDILIQQILYKTSDTIQEQKLNIVKKYKK